MSLQLMNEVFEIEGLSATKRLILLALAHHADEAGKCYPSIARLARRTGLCERAVRSNIRSLQADGFLSVNEAVGPGGSNVYFVRSTPAANAPRQEMPPGSRCTTPRQEIPQTPAGDAAKPLRKIIEPSVRAREQAVIEVLSQVLSRDVAKNFTAHRHALKKPMTEHAAKLVVSELSGHGDADAVANLSIMNGWQGLFPDRVPSKQSKPDQDNRAYWRQLADG